MAGFANIGEPGFRVAPPRLNPTGGPGFMKMLVPPPPRENAGFIDPTTGIAPSQLNNSPLHQGNLFLQNSGLGNLGSTSDPSSDPYGYSSQDLNSIQRFVANPLDPTAISNYQGLVSRTRNRLGSVPGLNPTQFSQFTNDLPIRFASGFGLLPPPVLQNFQIAPSTLPGLRF